MNALLNVEEPDGFPVGMICYVASSPELFHIRPGELVRITTPAHGGSMNTDGRTGERIDPPVPVYAHNVERLSPHTPPPEFVVGLDTYWCHVNMLRPATPDEIAEAGL